MAKITSTFYASNPSRKLLHTRNTELTILAENHSRLSRSQTEKRICVTVTAPAFLVGRLRDQYFDKVTHLMSHKNRTKKRTTEGKLILFPVDPPLPRSFFVLNLIVALFRSLQFFDIFVFRFCKKVDKEGKNKNKKTLNRSRAQFLGWLASGGRRRRKESDEYTVSI